MKLFNFLLALILCTAWCKVLNNSLTISELTLPPLGKLFNPLQGFWYNAFRPNGIQQITFEQGAAHGTVYFDEREVPHIQATSTSDAYFIQGFVHAYHRLWQMDFSTRATAGRISEIIGEKAINFDKSKRRKGLAESAKKSIEIWKKFPETYQLLESYSSGINYFMDHLDYRNYPIEYKLMNFEPEHWSPYKSALYHKSMSEVLCGKDQDIELTNAKNLFGVDFPTLFPEMDSITDPVIPRGTKWGFKLDSTFGLLKDSTQIKIIPVLKDSLPSGLGSNNWAIDATKSVSGNPVLCNDPHLQLSLPSIWYEQQIITPNLNVYGVSFAGIPGVVIGFNKDIAWGITNTAWDVQDWYKINWIDGAKEHYMFNGQQLKVNYRIDTIKIRDKKPIFDSVKITHWGPIVFEDSLSARYALALHWIIQDSFYTNELNTFVGLNQSKNYTDYRNAIRSFSYPAQNLAYADRYGNIALTVQGAMPLKSNEQGKFLTDGNTSSKAWHGFLPVELNPHILNPKRGFISSANQKSTAEDFPVYYNNGDFRDFRGTMINRLLAQKEKWSVEELMGLQFNNHSLLAEMALPAMLKNLNEKEMSSSQQKFCNELKSWNYEYDSISGPAVKFEIWFKTFYLMLWDEISSEPISKYTATPTELSTIRWMLSHVNSKYYDIKSTPQMEDLATLLSISLDSSILEFDKLSIHQWGRYKATHIDHLARIPAFSIPFISTSGSKDIINACWKTWGPSWRMVVELTANGPKAYGVYPGGQDGHPGNKHYMDLIEKWRTGQYYALSYCNTEADLKKLSKTEFQFVKK